MAAGIRRSFVANRHAFTRERKRGKAQNHPWKQELFIVVSARLDCSQAARGGLRGNGGALGSAEHARGDFALFTLGASAGVDRWRRYRLGFAGHLRVPQRAFSRSTALARG